MVGATTITQLDSTIIIFQSGGFGGLMPNRFGNFVFHDREASTQRRGSFDSNFSPSEVHVETHPAIGTVYRRYLHIPYLLLLLFIVIIGYINDVIYH